MAWGITPKMEESRRGKNHQYNLFYAASVIVSMDSKVFFVFLLLVGISHGLECYKHYPGYPGATVDPIRVQCPYGYDLCATGMYCAAIYQNFTMYWKSTILIADNYEAQYSRFNEDGTNRFCAKSQWLDRFQPIPQIGTCTETFWIDFGQNVQKTNLCLCSDDLCNVL